MLLILKKHIKGGYQAVKNKTFISMLAFLTVCVLVLVLCFSGVSVFASDPINLVSVYNVPEDPVVNYDTYTCFLDPLGV